MAFNIYNTSCRMVHTVIPTGRPCTGHKANVVPFETYVEAAKWLTCPCFEGSKDTYVIREEA